ncbi:glycosyl transferase [Aeromonas caviae]|uniref:Glycosyltransferase family 2 protein n=2 Tax=Aeromonas caviae TaxID=648 RepID=A0AAF0GFH2_AERCA|nr:glycosyltransferase family 2 protein [Aeromonas caviae]WGC86225.1 glycosyltransferase family 2 protein [Aeromonas caviae]BBG90125.1 glycosyl transferase [Aeromonas caviae]BBT53781.1 glycosyl transferase [Aeromonas caviae]
MKISLIVATIHRVSEVEDFLKSILCSSYKNIEILLIDQNKNGELDSIVLRYSPLLEIHHIKSSVKGLSYNRNIGIEMATGDILAFPDDDCTYYPDTIENVLSEFKNNDIDFVVGRIFDRDKKINVIKKWPRLGKKITTRNFYFLASSITLFTKVRKDGLIFFDERLGAGTIYGSCEDPDFIFTLLKKRLRGCYIPLIEVNHPIPNDINTPISKRVSYASGFGFMLGKHHNDLVFILMGMGFFIKNIVRLLFGKLSKSQFSEIISAMHSGFKDSFKNGVKEGGGLTDSSVCVVD